MTASARPPTGSACASTTTTSAGRSSGRPPRKILELLLGLANRVAAFWSLSTRLAEARHWLHTAVDRSASADPVLRARALGSLAQVASLAADMPTAMAAGTEGLALLRELGDSEGMIVALTTWARPPRSWVSPRPGGHTWRRPPRSPSKPATSAASPTPWP